jgi:hypothetical protein
MFSTRPDRPIENEEGNSRDNAHFVRKTLRRLVLVKAELGGGGGSIAAGGSAYDWQMLPTFY